jgi:hypothetical protein
MANKDKSSRETKKKSTHNLKEKRELKKEKKKGKTGQVWPTVVDTEE